MADFLHPRSRTASFSTTILHKGFPEWLDLPPMYRCTFSSQSRLQWSYIVAEKQFHKMFSTTWMFLSLRVPALCSNVLSRVVNDNWELLSCPKRPFYPKGNVCDNLDSNTGFFSFVSLTEDESEILSDTKRNYKNCQPVFLTRVRKWLPIHVSNLAQNESATRHWWNNTQHGVNTQLITRNDPRNFIVVGHNRSSCSIAKRLSEFLRVEPASKWNGQSTRARSKHWVCSSGWSVTTIVLSDTTSFRKELTHSSSPILGFSPVHLPSQAVIHTHTRCPIFSLFEASMFAMAFWSLPSASISWSAWKSISSRTPVLSSSVESLFFADME